jgi:hypothetical protein
MLAAAVIAARATRLVTRDTITAPLRRWAGQRFDQKTPVERDDHSHDGVEETDTDAINETDPDEKIGPVETFVGCAWCIGWWIALAAFTACYVAWPGHDWSAPQLIVWGATAAATNIIHGTVASTTERIGEIARTAEIAMLSSPSTSVIVHDDEHGEETTS